MTDGGRRAATAQGFAAVVFWGTSIAATRLIADSLGLLRGPVMSLCVSGAAGLAILVARPAERRKLRLMPASYWIVCGGLFVFYLVCYNLGVGLARDGQELLVFGVLNYLWPALTLVFAATFTKSRARWWIVPGLIAALAGTALALVARSSLGAAATPIAPTPAAATTDVARLLSSIVEHPVVYLLGIACGVSWALYSALARRLAGSIDANGVPLLLLSTAAALAVLGVVAPPLGLPALSLLAPGSGPLHPAGVAAFLWRALVVDLASYAFWDTAMRRGNQVLSAAASYLTPLLSAATVAVVIGVDPGWRLWAASVLVVAAAVTCWTAVRQR